MAKFGPNNFVLPINNVSFVSTWENEDEVSLAARPLSHSYKDNETRRREIYYARQGGHCNSRRKRRVRRWHSASDPFIPSSSHKGGNRHRLCWLFFPSSYRRRILEPSLRRPVMGKKLDRLLGRSFKPSKFKPVASLAVSRLAVLRNRSQTRLSQARSDVLQLLELAHHDRALLRVEQVMREQNTLDAYAMIEGYCHLLIERVNLIEQNKICPEELKEAASSLLFAASRCGEFPELHEMRALLTSRYGKEFAASAVELRNNCAVNPTMIQKLSISQPSLESRTKVLKEIAATNGIALHVDEPSDPLEGNTGVMNMPDQPISSVCSNPGVDNNMESTSRTRVMDDFSDSLQTQSKYKDVAEAAQAAFVSAAYAAAAARAAVELSRSESFDPDDQNSPSPSARSFEAKHNFSHTEKQLQNEHGAQGSVRSRKAAETRLSVSSSTSDSGELTTTARVGAGWSNYSQEETYFEESEDEKERDRRGSPSDLSSPMHIPSNFRAGTKAEPGAGGHIAHPAEATGMRVAPILDLERRPISVRTRHVRGY